MQRSLIEHEALLDIGLQLTRINCEIEEMRQVVITRAAVQADVLARMMREQAFEAPRVERWRGYLAGPMS